MPSGYFTLDQLLAILGATLQAVTGLLVALMSLSEWRRTRRLAFKYLGWAFSLSTLLHVVTAVTASWQSSFVRLSVPVWLHFLEGSFVVLLIYAMAAHERGIARETKRLTRWLLEVNLILAGVLQLLWFYAGRHTATATFDGYWGYLVVLVWELVLLCLASYLASSLRPEIQVAPALTLLAAGKAAEVASQFVGPEGAIWLSMVDWSAGAVSGVMLLAAAHFGIVAEVFTDALTKLHNRRYFMTRVPLEWDRARRKGSPFTVLVMDLDHFKRYNDTQGHVAGDTLLRGMARVLNHHLRPYDLLCRWGGEEFIALLPDTDAETGLKVAERLRLAIADAYGGPSMRTPVTISIGVAGWPEIDGDWRDVIQGADEALYRAKQWRNRVTLYVQ